MVVVGGVFIFLFLFVVVVGGGGGGGGGNSTEQTVFKQRTVFKEYSKELT